MLESGVGNMIVVPPLCQYPSEWIGWIYQWVRRTAKGCIGQRVAEGDQEALGKASATCNRSVH